MQLQREAMDLAFDYFRDVSAPLVRAQGGSLAILGAGNRESGFGCAISFWETRESLERSNANPKVVEAMGGYARWMAGPFKVESYAVVSGTISAFGPDDLRGDWLRLTSVMAPPETLTDVLAGYETRLVDAAASRACVGTLLLSPQIGSRVLAIELWSSHAALGSWDAKAKLDDQRLFRSGSVDQPPERDTLEVFGRY